MLIRKQTHMLKKVSYIFLGGIITGALFYLILFLVERTQPELSVFINLAIFIIMPLSVIVGSAVTGYLIKPIHGARSLLNYIFLSPGIYISVIVLFFNYRDFFDFFILSLLWGCLSVLGSLLGLHLRDKLSDLTTKI